MDAVKPEVRYARNGDVAIAFALVGDGPVDLVFVAPFGNLEVAWENPLFAQFLRRLATSARVVIIDRRGTGLPTATPSDDLPALEDLVDDVTVVLDAVGMERAALLDSPTPARSVRCSRRRIRARVGPDPVCDGGSRHGRPGLPWRVVGG